RHRPALEHRGPGELADPVAAGLLGRRDGSNPRQDDVAGVNPAVSLLGLGHPGQVRQGRPGGALRRGGSVIPKSATILWSIRGESGPSRRSLSVCRAPSAGAACVFWGGGYSTGKVGYPNQTLRPAFPRNMPLGFLVRPRSSTMPMSSVTM